MRKRTQETGNIVKYLLSTPVIQNKSDNCTVYALQKQLKNNKILTFL
jgi:hypothetical protein